MFNNIFKESDSVSKADILIISDFFASDISGGAELTTQALVDSAPSDINVAQIRCRDISLETLEKYFKTKEILA